MKKILIILTATVVAILGLTAPSDAASVKGGRTSASIALVEQSPLLISSDAGVHFHFAVDFGNVHPKTPKVEIVCTTPIDPVTGLGGDTTGALDRWDADWLLAQYTPAGGYRFQVYFLPPLQDCTARLLDWQNRWGDSMYVVAGPISFQVRDTRS